MSKKLIGEVIKEEAYEWMRSDIETNSSMFLRYIKNIFLNDCYSRGEPVNSIHVHEKHMNIVWGMWGKDQATVLAKFVGIEIKKNKNQMGVCYSLTIPTYVEGEKKTPAQEMWKQLLKEYQEQVEEDENDAEKLCRIVLKSLRDKVYHCNLNYASKQIQITVNMKYDYNSSKRYAWKEKVKSIMAENGFDPETCKMYYEHNEC